MTITDFKYKPFSINFKIPFRNSSSTFSERKGFIISVSDDMGNTSLGEASPLPGFSKESLFETGEDLEGLSHVLKQMETGDNLQDIKDVSDDYILCPSVRFAFEQAMFGLMIRRDKFIFEKLFLKIKNGIKTNAVIGLENDATVFGMMDRKICEGYSTFKIKVGRNSFTDDLNLVKGIRSKFSNDLIIRLDANGKWNIEEAKRNLDKLSLFNIEYIEEPCKGIENLISLSRNSSIPIAVDESMNSINDASGILEESNLSAIIIKPMILGAFLEIIDIIKQAAVYDKNIIISSAFETTLGKDLLLFLSSLTHHCLAHGPDTQEYFSDYFFEDRSKAKNGIIEFSPSSLLYEYDFDAVC